MRFFRISSFFSLLRSAEVSKCTDRAVWGSKVLPVCFKSPIFLRRPVFENAPLAPKGGVAAKKTFLTFHC